MRLKGGEKADNQVCMFRMKVKPNIDETQILSGQQHSFKAIDTTETWSGSNDPGTIPVSDTGNHLFCAAGFRREYLSRFVGFAFL